jgi:hypothetical protein
MFIPENLQRKWAPLLNTDQLEPIKDKYRRAVTAQLLENQESFLRDSNAFESGTLLTETPTNSANAPGLSGGFTGSASAAGPVAGFDPILISLIRRSMPNLVAYDLAGVQPMTGPSGLIFALRSRYTNQSGPETFFDEVNTSFSGQNNSLGLAGFGSTAAGFGTTTQRGSNPGLLNPTETSTENYNVGQGMETGDAENLGNGDSNQFNEMAFSIEKVPVLAQSRALAGEYSLEMMQDLRAIHNLSAEAELANILSTEILSEINREVIRTIYKAAEQGAVNNVATPGVFDLDVDSNGRWSVEKFKGLIFQIDRDANAIAQRTRRGKGNVIMCSADVASALTMAGVLDYTPALNANLNVDDTGNLFAGTLNGKYKVYIDAYSANVSNTHYYVVGYKGSSPMDAGLFYCPYVPLQMVRAVDPKTFQPRIGFKSRYGMVANPYAEGLTQGLGRITANSNRYYRRTAIKNIM